MREYQLTNFKRSDLDEIEAMPGLISFLRDNSGEKIFDEMAKSIAFTLRHEGKIVAMGGVFPLWKGVAEAWFMPSVNAKKHKIKLVQVVLVMMRMLIQEYHIVRIQGVVDAANDRDLKFASRLGFKPEGIMRKYYAGRDFLRMAKVEEV